MIEIKGLKKKFGKEIAIEDFDLIINEGESYGILGTVNSGCSTVFDILGNYVIKDEGTVLIDDKEPEDARDLLYVCPNLKFFPNFTFRKILESMSKYNSNFDMDYALELCASFKIDLNKKHSIEENVGICNIFSTILTICMDSKYLLFDNPEIGVSSFDIRKLSDLLMGNMKRKGYTPIIHCKTINFFFDYIDNIVILKNKKVILCEKRSFIKERVYSVSGSSDVIKSATEGKNVIAVKSFKNFSKLNTAYIIASSQEEFENYSDREVSLKELYEAIVDEGGAVDE